jgi:heme exporter protein A
MSPGVQISVENVAQRFGRRWIYRDITFSVVPGEILAVLGRNGSGKSTLLRTIAKILTPTKGSCEWALDGNKIADDQLLHHRGFVAPYLELYNDLTALEHLEFLQRLRGAAVARATNEALFDRVGLRLEGDLATRHLGAFSSGMKQRVRLAMAVERDPHVLLLDEPTSNLDDDGQRVVQDELLRHQKRGGITIIATNEARERDLATRHVQLD